jgi:hypothetical protein
MDALSLVRAAGLPHSCIGAGSVRSAVWAQLLTPGSAALPEGDVDVAYFDPSCTSRERDAEIRRELERARPDLRWDVVNQAGVHSWYEDAFGEPLSPFASLEEAVGSWPEVATCVGVSLSDDGSIEVIAPLGLGDLFELVVRRNPKVSERVYQARLADKRFDERWPCVTVLS